MGRRHGLRVAAAGRRRARAACRPRGLRYSFAPDSLVDAIVEFLGTHYRWRIDKRWIVWLPSVVPGLELACRAFAAEREAVLTVTPVYPPFLEAPPHQGRRLVTVSALFDEAAVCDRLPPATCWRLPLTSMAAACGPDTRLLLFCHPHNPLGRVWRREEIEEVVAFCREHDLVLCSDEIHCDLLLDRLGHVPAAALSDEATEITVTLMAPSKTFNLPGLNFAFAVIPNEGLRRRFEAAAGGLLPFPGCLAIAAAEAAYRRGGPWLVKLLEYLRGNVGLVERFICDELPRVRMTHVEATYLAWLDVRAVGLHDPGAACVRAGVALSDGADFGAPGFLRLNFACPRAILEEALTRLRGVLG